MKAFNSGKMGEKFNSGKMGGQYEHNNPEWDPFMYIQTLPGKLQPQFLRDVRNDRIYIVIVLH